jgi:hypothetical protein
MVQFEGIYTTTSSFLLSRDLLLSWSLICFFLTPIEAKLNALLYDLMLFLNSLHLLVDPVSKSATKGGVGLRDLSMKELFAQHS